MKPTTLALIVPGVALVLAGGVASLLVPVRTETVGLNTPGGGWSEETYRKTLWGRTTHYRQHVTYSSPDQKIRGEGDEPTSGALISQHTASLIGYRKKQL